MKCAAAYLVHTQMTLFFGERSSSAAWTTHTSKFNRNRSRMVVDRLLQPVGFVGVRQQSASSRTPVRYAHLASKTTQDVSNCADLAIKRAMSAVPATY